MYSKYLGILSLILFLSSCTHKMSYVNHDEVSHVPEGNGLVVIGLTTNSPYYKLNISGKTSTDIEYDLLKKADPFIVVSLPFGDYEFERVWLNKYQYVELNDSDNKQNWKFSVRENEITYVGNLAVSRKLGNRFYIRIINRSSEAFEFLDKGYSDVLKSKKIRFSGSEKDNFMAYLSALKGYNND